MFSIRDVAKQNNLLLAYHRLLTNPESTYKNFFRDAYSAYGMAAERNITLLRSKIKAGYLPANTIRVFMPKANGLNRMYTLMSIEDQIVYQAYANVLVEALVANPKVRRRYKKSVFGNLYSNADMVTAGWAVRLANWRNSFCSCFYSCDGEQKTGSVGLWARLRAYVGS